MKKKNLNSTSIKKNITPKIDRKQKIFTLKSEKGFGGIPDVDPKKFMGCG